MASFLESVSSGVRSGICGILSEDAAVGGLLTDAGILTGGLGIATGVFRRQFCNDPTPAPGLSPGFTGGQCPVGYTVTTKIKFTNPANGFSVFNDIVNNGIIGPISGVRVVSSNFPGRVVIDGGNGAQDIYNENTDTIVSEPVITSISRNDGQPDNCGDPAPGPYPPITFVDAPITINYDDGNSNNFTAVGTLRLFAPVFLPGSIVPTFNFNLDLGGLNLTGNLNFDGEISFQPEFNFGTGTGGPDPLDINDDPESRVIVGAKVVSTILTNERVGRIGQDDNPDIYIPRLGSIMFKQRVGRGSAWTRDIDVKNLVAYVPCPDPGIAIAVDGTPSPGVAFAITPIYQGPPRV